MIDCSASVALSRAETLHDAVGVDVEGDLDLGLALRRRRNVREHELAEQVILGRLVALALEHPDLDRGLVVARGREDVRLLHGRGRVAFDQGRRSGRRRSRSRARAASRRAAADRARRRPACCPGSRRPPRRPRRGSRRGATRLPKYSVTAACTIGVRVWPPTSTTWSMSFAREPRVGHALLDALHRSARSRRRRGPRASRDRASRSGDAARSRRSR